MEAIIIILVVMLFGIFFLNTFMRSELDTIFFSLMFGVLLAFYSAFLISYTAEKTIIHIENKEMPYEVTSIEQNTGKVLTIKLLNE